MQRNGQNPIKAVKDFGKKIDSFNNGLHAHTKSAGGAGLCPNCKTEIPPKAGFRFSALKCPKCGLSMAKK